MMEHSAVHCEFLANTAPALVLDAALSRTGGDHQLLAELAGLFLQEFPESIARLRLAMSQGNAEDVEMYAHGLKGSVSNFGADQATAYALQLEETGRRRDLTEALEILTALEGSLDSLSGELQALAGEGRTESPRLEVDD